jgi:NAD(P)-dependent dehydrogenase (short-subunit alcohol dehydrogenase family)
MTRGAGGEAVVITGAGTGLGLATALHLAGRGFRVFATVPEAAQEEAVHAAAAAAGVRLDVRRLDVTDAESVTAAMAEVAARCGGVYALVNNAGLALRGFFEDLAEDEIRRVFAVNVFGAMAATRAVLPHMRAARRGRVVFLGSVGGKLGSMTLSAYCATKFALEGLAESLLVELGGFGIHVSLIEPGLVVTPLLTVNRGRARAAIDPASPYHRWFVRHEALADDLARTSGITPHDVARAVERPLVSRRPRLRYVVGRGARLMVALQRYLPDEFFARLYARQVLRMVQRPTTGDGAGVGTLAGHAAGLEGRRD